MRCITKLAQESLASYGIFIELPYNINKVTPNYIFIKDGTSVFVISREVIKNERVLHVKH